MSSLHILLSIEYLIRRISNHPACVRSLWGNTSLSPKIGILFDDSGLIFGAPADPSIDLNLVNDKMLSAALLVVLSNAAPHGPITFHNLAPCTAPSHVAVLVPKPISGVSYVQKEC